MVAENNLDLSALESLSVEEKKYALKILKDYANGSAKSLNDLKYSDYKEIPVDIVTFIKDRKYLGNAWHLSDGKCKLFPFWENKLKELFPDNLKTNFNTFIESGARGLGKAQPLDSLVFTEYGYRKMNDIHVGDLVYGNDGKLHNVTGVFPQGIKKVCKITFSDNTTTLCCDEHLWTVYDSLNNKVQKTITCKEIYKTGIELKDKRLRYRIPITKPIELTHKDTYISPYLIGMIISNGKFSKDSFNFKSIDEDILLDYIEYLKNYNLYEKQDKEKFIPEIYLYNDIESRIELLDGLLSEHFNVRKNIYATNSEEFAKQFIFLIQSLGGIAILYKDKEYNIQITLPDSIAYKLKNYKNNSLTPSRYIKSIEYVDSQECKCILIDSKEHLYLTNDLIVTHNSEIAIAVSLYLMHRLMCLKDPYLTLNLKPTEKVAFAFMNITKDLALDIGMVKFQNTVQCSPWFMERGTLTGLKTKVWNPPSFINIIIGSQSSDVIGQAIYYCLEGETRIVTTQGIYPIKDLIDKQIKVFTVDSNNNIVISNYCTVKETAVDNNYIEIELDDNTVIKCTPNHKLMLKNGIYKEAQDLTIDDELMDLTNLSSEIKFNNATPMVELKVVSNMKE